MKKVILTTVTLISLLSACNKKEESVTPTNSAPVVSIAEDDRALRISKGGAYFSYYATATDANGSISKVIFYVNNTPYDTVLTSSSANKYYNESGYYTSEEGTYKFHAIAYDNAGASTKSNELTQSYTVSKIEGQVLISQ
ncbi:MAG: hypothetical protein RLZZ175_3372 [Bacteroidota bacterium]|jgi:hypothetical protein